MIHVSRRIVQLVVSYTYDTQMQVSSTTSNLQPPNKLGYPVLEIANRD